MNRPPAALFSQLDINGLSLILALAWAESVGRNSKWLHCALTGAELLRHLHELFELGLGRAGLDHLARNFQPVRN
jgi:hypothetical protein